MDYSMSYYDNCGDIDTIMFNTEAEANEYALKQLIYNKPREGYEVHAVKVSKGNETLWTATNNVSDWVNPVPDIDEKGGLLIRHAYPVDVIKRFPECNDFYEFLCVEVDEDSCCYAYHGIVNAAEIRDELGYDPNITDALVVRKAIDEKGAMHYAGTAFHGAGKKDSRYDYGISGTNVKYWVNFMSAEKNNTKTNPFLGEETKRPEQQYHGFKENTSGCCK